MRLFVGAEETLEFRLSRFARWRLNEAGADGAQRRADEENLADGTLSDLSVPVVLAHFVDRRVGQYPLFVRERIG
jgi:hypothetical protein